ncbi:MAG: chromate resistance protein ChrB domain-containing protein [Candidatus Rokuibacteriota bacterium]
MPWLVLIVSLPPHPSSLRVRVWRRLRARGAVPLKNSVYLLPLTAENQEDFQWLAQEIRKDGGEATLLKVDQIENMTPDEVVRLFQEARDQDYRQLAERGRKLLGALDRTSAGRRVARRDEELARLTRELERIKDIDFFDAPGRREVERLREALEIRLRPPDTRERPGPAGGDPARFRGRRWVTRPRPHVDRLASAWLIKRFIDPDAEFLFVPPDEFPEGAIPFDAPGAEFSHHGDDCTFETLLTRFGLRDRRLGRLAEIVHEVDLRDDKFGREEARGVDLAIRGLLAALKDDHELLAHGLTLFDGLYAMMGRR